MYYNCNIPDALKMSVRFLCFNGKGEEFTKCNARIIDMIRNNILGLQKIAKMQ